jgi:23S rRNA pseudouridine1911/1915/1917 synthase
VDTVEVLYEDNHLLALNKPAGLLTQPSGTPGDSLEAQAKAWIKQTRYKPGEVFLHAVHRLDRPVSGIVLFARTSKALSRMNRLMRNREVQKVYHAVITGRLPGDEGTLRHHLRHARMHSELAHDHESGAREGILHYRVMERSRFMSLVEIRLETGRYHQIRAQLAGSGCPVLGDGRYGGRAWQEPGAIALHHQCMEFSHPTLKTPVTITAPYPAFWTLPDLLAREGTPV